MPCPMRYRPSRIERGSGVRLSQPKRAAPFVRHSRRARVEKGRPLYGSVSVSLRRRSSTGSMPVAYASSSMAHSSAKWPCASMRRPQHDRRVAVHVDDFVARRDPAAGTPQMAAGHRGIFNVVVEYRCRD